MDVREKLIEIVCDAMESDGCIGHCNHSPCFEVERVVNALIDNGVTVHEWIPVEERLPERDGPVLTSYGFSEGGEISDMRFFSVLRYYAVDPKPHFQHEGYRGLTVTHWMPLPKPPKGE